jgi:lipoyl(octanoyl) transferase
MPEWRISEGLVAYPEALAAMEARVAAIRAGAAEELVWLLEHPPLYTAGTSADPRDLLAPDRFPVYAARRGGEYTYHGPGQRVAYAMLDLDRRGRDVRAYVHALEEWVIAALAEFGVRGERRPGRVGVWVVRPERAGQGAGPPSTRSRRSACGCGAGSPSTASRSTWSRTSPISTASCPAASAGTG